MRYLIDETEIGHQRNPTIYQEREKVDFVTHGTCEHCDTKTVEVHEYVHGIIVNAQVGYCKLYFEFVSPDETTDCEDWREG